ncbi:MAG: serine hydrolase domain-containing protein [Spirochaetota bacterium]
MSRNFSFNTAALSQSVEARAREADFSGVVSVTGLHEPFVRAYGLAERAHGIANTPETRFGIASGTKFLTALAIGTLVDAGAFAFTTPVQELLSFDLPRFHDGITIHHLLTHTSGIFDYYDEELVEDFDNFFVSIPWYQLTTPRDYLPLFQDEAMKFDPGARFSYSNGGYILLGIVVEEVTGRLFRQVVAESVLAAAGMDDSGFFALNQLPERTATGYMVLEDGTIQSNVYNLPRIGASDGGAFLTAADAERLWKAFFAGRIVAPETRDIFTTGHVPTNEHVSYGYGLYIWNEPDEPAYFIVGGDAGVGFDSRHFPERGVTATILSNVTNGEDAMRGALYAPE